MAVMLVQAKDISDDTMLALVAECNNGTCSYPMDAGWHGGRPGYAFDPTEPAKGHWANWSDLCLKMPDVPPKVVLAKMRQLIKRHLVDGCGCGCRGDFINKTTDLWEQHRPR